MTTSREFEQLKTLLKAMFQFEENDLDFGIYRITRLKKQFIQNFIDGDGENSLRATVTQALGGMRNTQAEAARNWLASFASTFGEMGQNAWDAIERNPADVEATQQFKALLAMPMVLAEKREQAHSQLNVFLAASQTSTEQLEVKVYNHLVNFFELYYQNGDFGYNSRAASVFKVPYDTTYDGADTQFHWKHKDSYYIKTGNGFNSVRFELLGEWIEFRLGDGNSDQAVSTEQNNNKETATKHYQLAEIVPIDEYDSNGTTKTIWQVRFILSSSSTPKTDLYPHIWATIFRESTDLTPWLFRQPGKGDGNTSLAIFNNLADDYDKSEGGQLRGIGQLRIKFDKYVEELAKRAEFSEFGKNAAERQQALKDDRTAKALWHLDRNLNKFYAGNDADYFIHKDLSSFLSQQKAAFIKQVIFSDLDALLFAEVDNTTALIARAFNQVADILVGFLSAIEEFQKNLYELKKKVVDTHFLISVGKVPSQFWERIVANERQCREWLEVYQVDIDNASQLREHPTLVVDTSYFRDSDPTLQDEILAHADFDNLDDQIDGLLINSENWQALNLLQDKFREKIKCVYVDPPYNTGSDGFLYKDTFRHSSWMSMIFDRLVLTKSLLKNDGVFFSSIDHNERANYERALGSTFGASNRVEELIWAQNTNDNRAPAYSTNHEYVLVYAKDKAAATSRSRMFREKRPGYAEIMDLVDELGANYPTIEEVEAAIKALMDAHLEDYKKELQELGMTYDKETQKQDPWRGIYNYKRVEYRDSAGKYVTPEKAEEAKATLWVWREADSSAPPKEEARKITDPTDPNFRFYKPIHPVTKKPCPHPNGGWRLRFEPDPTDPSKDSFRARDEDNRIVWGQDEKKVPQLKRFLHEVGGNAEDEGGTAVPKSVFHDYTDGAKQLESLFGKKGVFRFPKPTSLMGRFFEQTTEGGDWVLDYFVGSGTTAHSVLKLNKEYGAEAKRRFIVVEMGDYADFIVKERIKRVMFSVSWKAGAPANENGLRTIVKVNRLEQYEDVLDNLVGVWDESELPAQVSVKYLFRPEQRALYSSLDLSKPFSQTLRVGKIREEKPIDLMETWCYLQGYWVKSRRVFKHLDRPYLVVETSTGTLIVFRDIQPGEDDTKNIISILDDYNNSRRGPSIQRLEINHDVDLRKLDLETRVIDAADFMRGPRWN